MAKRAPSADQAAASLKPLEDAVANFREALDHSPPLEPPATSTGEPLTVGRLNLAKRDHRDRQLKKLQSTYMDLRRATERSAVPNCISDVWLQEVRVQANEAFCLRRNQLYSWPGPLMRADELQGRIDYLESREEDVYHLRHGNGGQPSDGERLADRPDRKADNSKKKNDEVPRNPKVMQLAQRINDRRNRRRTKIAIARELTEENEKEAESLLRQLGRFPHLLK
jgi:hypothetical protein